jgi:osmoprotectant transport system substrate-binding protein
MKRILLLCVALFVVAGTAMAGGQGENQVTVGAKNFTEQYIVGHMIAIMLEQNGYNVNQQFGLSSNAVRNALTTGQVDVYAEYTGTAWIVYLDHDEQINDPQELFESVKEEDLEENDVLWFARTDVNNTYALAVREDFAEEHNVQTLSDLEELADSGDVELTVGVGFEFFERPDGFPALTEHYGINVPRSNIETMELGLTYEAINREDVNVAMVFATDGKLRRFNLRVLEDDQNFFTPYHLAFAANKEFYDANPDVEEILMPLAETLTADIMIDLNYRVDAEEQEPANVARTFLEDQGLIDGDE